MIMKKKIMVVDDEIHLSNLVKTILKMEGFKVTTASSGEEALKKLRRVKPDLMLLDMIMPGMTGIETLRKIRKTPRIKNINVILLTVLNISDIDKSLFKELNVIDFITKPFDNTTFANKIKNLANC
jgi:DNA-binding response OmpR family regulator